MKVLYFLLLVLTFASCRTPQQKFDRLVKKHPELVSDKEIVIRDTIKLEGETIVNHIPIKYKNITIKLDERFNLSFDSSGKLQKDSFLFNKDDVKVKLFTDSTSIWMAIEYNKKVIEAQKYQSSGKRLKQEVEISDSAIMLKSNLPDTDLPIELKTKVPVYCGHDINKVIFKTAITTFFATLILLMFIARFFANKSNGYKF